MKTPDKIYLLSPRKDVIGKVAFEEPVLAENFGEQKNVEYIRKDALLEWLQHKIETNKWFYETHSKPNNLHPARCEAYQNVIDKINSL